MANTGNSYGICLELSFHVKMFHNNSCESAVRLRVTYSFIIIPSSIGDVRTHCICSLK